MKNPQVKQRIKVNRPGRGYQPGKSYLVARIDNSDNTLIATDAEGNEGNWIKWDHCMPAGDDINWSWLKGQLSGESLELLSAFEGLETLRLRDEIRDRILLQLPNLKERILCCQVQIEEECNVLGDRDKLPEDADDKMNEPPF